MRNTVDFEFGRQLKVAVLGGATATLGAALVFVALQLAMMANGFAPVVFQASVVGLLLAPWFGYRFAARATNERMLRAALGMTAVAVLAGRLATTVVSVALLLISEAGTSGAASNVNIGQLAQGIALFVLLIIAAFVLFGFFASILLFPLVLVWIATLRGLCRLLKIQPAG